MSGKIKSRQTKAFTLLEVLVVISIIALLMGLMLPALRQAREQSKQIVCRKNLTNIWRGVLVYSIENRDRIPYMEQIDPSVDPFSPEHPTVVGNVLGPYVERFSFVCPSAVAGYPDTDPTSRRRWKLTYDFSTADLRGPAVPYDDAPGAFTGREDDPAVANMFHFDGRPLRSLTITRANPQPSGPEDDGTGGGDDSRGGGVNDDENVEVIWTVAQPLVADSLAENKPGDIVAGRPRYPHRGVVRRQTDVYRALAKVADPRVITARRSGYFHLHAQGERSDIFLTRFSPDNNPDD